MVPPVILPHGLVSILRALMGSFKPERSILLAVVAVIVLWAINFGVEWGRHLTFSTKARDELLMREEANPL
jgi:hypothetical protein